MLSTLYEKSCITFINQLANSVMLTSCGTQSIWPVHYSNVLTGAFGSNAKRILILCYKPTFDFRIIHFINSVNFTIWMTAASSSTRGYGGICLKTVLFAHKTWRVRPILLCFSHSGRRHITQITEVTLAQLLWPVNITDSVMSILRCSYPLYETVFYAASVLWSSTCFIFISTTQSSCFQFIEMDRVIQLLCSKLMLDACIIRCFEYHSTYCNVCERFEVFSGYLLQDVERLFNLSMIKI